LDRIKRTIDRLDRVQEEYDKGRASGKIPEPIDFLEH
jgi:HAMP domain-containing protein